MITDQVINQDSPWKLPPSPQSSPKECGSASQWKSSTSSGTEIWENTVRHKSKGPTPTPGTLSAGQPSWGHHTPSTHIGGTWGEEEDPSNHWTGVPNANNTNNWSGNVTNNTNNGNNNNMNNNNNNNSNNNMQWNQSSDNKNNSENNSRHNSETRHNPENRPKPNQNTSWSDYNGSLQNSIPNHFSKY